MQLIDYYGTGELFDKQLVLPKSGMWAYLELLGVDTASWAVMTLHNDHSVPKGVQLASCS